MTVGRVHFGYEETYSPVGEDACEYGVRDMCMGGTGCLRLLLSLTLSASLLPVFPFPSPLQAHNRACISPPIDVQEMKLVALRHAEGKVYNVELRQR